MVIYGFYYFELEIDFGLISFVVWLVVKEKFFFE